MLRAMDVSLAAAVSVARPALRWQWSRLPDMTAQDLYAVMMLRQQVFVVEQSCAFLDADGCDVDAWHLLGWDAGAADFANGRLLAAYLRVIDAGAKYSEPSIGRVVTAPARRRTGLGRQLMVEGIARTTAVWPGRAVRIGAQQRLEAFYAELGFRTVSAPYQEDGIVHVEMLRTPPAAGVAP
jgi:ElaA protein